MPKLEFAFRRLHVIAEAKPFCDGIRRTLPSK
jgi:hypothetical protein